MTLSKPRRGNLARTLPSGFPVTSPQSLGVRGRPRPPLPPAPTMPATDGTLVVTGGIWTAACGACCVLGQLGTVCELCCPVLACDPPPPCVLLVGRGANALRRRTWPFSVSVPVYIFQCPCSTTSGGGGGSGTPPPPGLSCQVKLPRLQMEAREGRLSGSQRAKLHTSWYASSESRMGQVNCVGMLARTEFTTRETSGPSTT